MDTTDLPTEPADPGRLLAEIEQVTDAALSHLSLDELLVELLERIAAVIGSDTAAILLLDRQRNVLVARAAKGIEEEVRRGVTIPLGAGFAGRIAAERRPIFLEDVDTADIRNPLLRDRGIKSLLGVPLIVGGRVIGVLHVGTLTHRQFTEEDTRLLQLAADRATLAIEHTRLYEQRRLAETLQRTLLPTEAPVMPGLDIAARYVPASAESGLGGDWYDSFDLPDGRLGLAIGDVVGQGVAVAALMAQVRTALRAYALEGHPPAVVVERLEALLRGRGRGHAATLAYFAFDHETGEVAGVSAGHPPPLVVHAGKGHYVEMASGPPLGATRGARYAESTFQLGVDALLVLYTDGLVERREEPIDAGLEKLRIAAARASGSAVVICDALLSELAAEDQDDDIAVMAVRTTPLTEDLHLQLPAEPEILASLRRHVARWLHEMDVEQSIAYDVVLAVSEAAANAIEHAYAPGPANFEVDARFAAGEIAVTVSDAGSWRPEGRQDRGRGLMLMRALMDDVAMDTAAGGGTAVVMRRLLPEPGR